MGSDFADLAPSEEWRRAFEAAPREYFIPDAAWVVPMGDAPSHWIDRRVDPQAWREAVYSDSTIVTQIDDGATELTEVSVRRSINRSSSGSAPSLVLEFLELLEPYEGDRVLEIGTGTGWTAALLSARLGAENVTSVEVDEQVAKQAAAHLGRAGFSPNLVVADGAQGWPDGALYDRVHATCGVRSVPYAWVQQTRPGGVIAAPWMPDSGGGFQTRLVATGREAVGRFHGGCRYMLLRSQRLPLVPIPGEDRESMSQVDPRRLDGPGLEVAVAGLLPGVSVGRGVTNPVDGTYRMSLRELGSDSHAIAIQPPGGGSAEVVQSGPRSLWEELEAAYLAWVGWGEPGSECFGLTVDAEGQHVWLHSSDNRIAEVEH